MIRLTTVILIATFMQVSASSYGQRITLNAKNTALEKVLKDIRLQSGYDFLFSEALIKTSKPISISVKDASIDEVLEKCFDGQPINYKIENKTVLLKEKKPSMLERVTTLFTGIDVYGVVVDLQNNPLAGATVTVKDGKRSTTTGVGGQFSLKGIPEDAILQISFMGYVTREVKANSNLLGVKLELSTSKLDEVQVMAYGKTNRRLSTSNIVTVTAADIDKQPVQNPLMALQGRVPGMIISQTNGYASSPVKIEIRGRQALGTDFASEPLYIIDGVPMNNLDVGQLLSGYQKGSSGVIQNDFSPSGGQSPFYNINPKDIESIEVLKDADATAIYGSRGAKGVILITTKKGKPGATKFSVRGEQGFSTVTQRWDMLNTQQYLELRRAALRNDNLTPDPINAPDLMLWDTTKYTDWQKKLWGNVGKQTNVSMDLSGGDTQTQFRLSGNYGKQTEILSSKGSNQRGGLAFNLGHSTLNRKLKVDFSAMYNYTARNDIATPSVVTLAPNAPDIYNEKGLLNYEPWNQAGLTNFFPFTSLETPSYSNTHLLNSSLNISYALLNNLSVSTRFGYGKTTNTNKGYFPITSQNPLLVQTGSAFSGTNDNYNLLIEPQINYNTKVGPGQLTVLVGGSFQKTATSGASIYAYGYESDDLLQSITLAPYTLNRENLGAYKYAAIFGRINYNIGDKYILNLNGRRDGSSRFAPGTRFGNFGSIGAAWIISKEEWFKTVIPSFVSFMKLRGSYGLTGSDGIGDYQYLTRWTKGPSDYRVLPDYDGNTPIINTQAVNQQYKWQVNKKLEGALSLGFLEDKFTLEAAFYRDRCGNQLTQYPTPIYTGFAKVAANWPATIENSGWEVSLTANVMHTDQINWNVRFNGSRNFNKLLAYPDIEHSPYYTTYKIGESVNNIYVFHYTGVSPLTGQYTFEDYNHNGQLDDRTNGTPGSGLDDRYVRIDLTPKFNGGIGTDFNYKNLTVSCFFDYKNQMGLASGVTGGTTIGWLGNLPADVAGNYWKQPGDIAKYPKPTTLSVGSTVGQYSNSDAVYENHSYIRLSNIAVSYAIDQKLIKKLGAESLRVYMNAQNVFLISNSKGIDPDVQFGALPPARTILFGLSLNF